MNNKLNKNCTGSEYADFAVYCNERGLHIEATDTDYYALESYQTIKNGEVYDLRNDAQYQQEQLQIQLQNQKIVLSNQIDEIDKKRIRAICEPEIKNSETGETWLDYYNSQILTLRQELAAIG